MIEVYLTNLGKYNEGDLVGAWITLPMSKAELHEAFLNIGIDGKHYEEYFLTDHQSEIAGLSQYIGEYESIDVLNCLAEKLSELSASNVKLLESCIEMGEVSQLSDVYKVIEHLDDYQLYEDINDDEDLGYYWLNDSGAYDLSKMGNLEFYIDYERYGRDVRLNEGGCFSSNGYVVNVG